MRYKITTTLLLLLIAVLIHAQDAHLKKVLEKAIVNKEFIFGKWTEEGGQETHLTYLGRVKTFKGKIYKIVNYSWHWGSSHRATSRIIIFNNADQYIGEYNVTLITDLPSSIKNGKLVFKNTNEDCDSQIFSQIDLKRGLPKMFFRKCKEKSGDLYTFSSSN